MLSFSDFNLLYLDLSGSANSLFLTTDSLSLSVIGVLGLVFIRQPSIMYVASLFQLVSRLNSMAVLVYLYGADLQGLHFRFYLYITLLIFISGLVESVLDRLSDFGHMLYMLLGSLSLGLITFSYNLFIVYFFLELLFLCVICPLFLIY